MSSATFHMLCDRFQLRIRNVLFDNATCFSFISLNAQVIGDLKTIQTRIKQKQKKEQISPETLFEVINLLRRKNGAGSH